MSVSLKISRFSCIEKAQLTLSPLTVIVGPQASGKSVVSKLLFFFVNLWSEQFSTLEEAGDIEAFKAAVKESFCRYFPVAAWGGGEFLD